MHSRQDPNQPHSSRNCTSSSAAHLTDLAQAAEGPEQATQDLHQGKDSFTEGEKQFSMDMDEDEEEQWLTQPSQAADETEALNGISGSRPTSQLAQAASQSTSSVLNDNEDIVHTQATRQARGRQILHPAALHPFCRYDQTNEQEASTQQKRQRVSQPPSGVGDLHTGSQPAKQIGASSVSNTDLGGERQDEQRQVVSDKGSLEGWHDQATEGEERAAGGMRGGSERRVPRRQSLLMRLIDDFLFITPSHTAAEALVNKLLKGKLLHLRTSS